MRYIDQNDHEYVIYPVNTGVPEQERDPDHLPRGAG
jgi:hypothetical protein